MNFKETETYVKQYLQKIYPQGEAQALATLLLEYTTGFTYTQRLVQSNQLLTPLQTEQLQYNLSRLADHEPIQYITNEAWFCHNKFYVDKNVLIPRPETEELVMWIEDSADKTRPLKILDIGTGSGCIAISLEKLLPNARIYAADYSYTALNVAQKNAEELDADVHFIYADILSQNNKASHFAPFDMVVSNPPYIAQNEKRDMPNNVLLHEPHTALFVENNSPLLFYEKIIAFCKQNLHNDGLLFFEINEQYGKQIVQLHQANGFENIILKKDLQGKDRMTKATLKKNY